MPSDQLQGGDDVVLSKQAFGAHFVLAERLEAKRDM